MTLLEAILTVVSAGLLLTVTVVLIRANGANKTSKGGDTPPLEGLVARIDQLSESLNGLKSRQKEVEGEWEVYYAKMRKLAGKAYREDQVADGKHKGAAEEEPASHQVTPEEWKIAMTRRKHGIG